MATDLAKAAKEKGIEWLISWGFRNVVGSENRPYATLTVEAAAMAGVPLAGTNWIPGRGGG